MFKYLLFLPVAIYCMISCSSTKKRPRPPASKITVVESRSQIAVGTPVNLAIKTRLKNGVIRSSSLYLDGRLIEQSKQVEYKLILKTDTLRVGKHQLKIVVENEDGMKGTNYASFQLLSDKLPKELKYEVVGRYYHDQKLFTEGLEINNGYVYESTGEHGESGIYRYKLGSKKTETLAELHKSFFGEGMTVINDRIYQATYKSQKGFVYDFQTVAKIDSFSYANKEGWGMTNNQQVVYMSDGTNEITVFDPNGMKKIDAIQVCDNRRAVDHLNELEYVDGYIWANVWLTDRLVKIDANSGKVVATVDLSDLSNEQMLEQVPDRDVMNGIAWNPIRKTMLVTGKRWSKLYEIKITD